MRLMKTAHIACNVFMKYQGTEKMDAKANFRFIMQKCY
jgi:hypothetical protein